MMTMTAIVNPPLSSSYFLTTTRTKKLHDPSSWRRSSVCISGRETTRWVSYSNSSSSPSSRGCWWWWRPTTTRRAAPLKAASTSPTTTTTTISDVFWSSLGGFVAMAVLGRLDHFIAPKLGVSFTIAPLGAVCAVLLTSPNSPAAQRENMFVAQIACAAFGVLALSIFGPGWLARSISLAASIAFMLITRTTHPPAASLPILFIDGARFHQLQFWYMLFPGAAGCLILCLIQEMVLYLKSNFRF